MRGLLVDLHLQHVPTSSTQENHQWLEQQHDWESLKGFSQFQVDQQPHIGWSGTGGNGSFQVGQEMNSLLSYFPQE